MLSENTQLIRKSRLLLLDLLLLDINKYLDLFFFENSVYLDKKYTTVLEEVGIVRNENGKWVANVMVFPFRQKLIVTDFLLSKYRKKGEISHRGLDDVWVMFPHETLLFIERLGKIKGKQALDIASGSGAISLFLADKFKTVTASDINPKAVKYARFNAVLNNLDNKIINIQSDMFSKLGNTKYDFICWNGPTVAMPEIDEPDKVYPLYTYGGFDGAEFTRKFLDQVFLYTNKGYVIKWWDGCLGDSQQSTVEKYIRTKLSDLPIKVTIEFLNKRRGVLLKEYDRLYDKYCLDKFDLGQNSEQRGKAEIIWREKLEKNNLSRVYI